MVVEVNKKEKETNYQLLQGRRDHAIYIGSWTPAGGELGEANDFFPIPACLWGCSSMDD